MPRYINLSFSGVLVKTYDVFSLATGFYGSYLKLFAFVRPFGNRVVTFKRWDPFKIIDVSFSFVYTVSGYSVSLFIIVAW